MKRLKFLFIIFIAFYCNENSKNQKFSENDVKLNNSQEVSHGDEATEIAKIKPKKLTEEVYFGAYPVFRDLVEDSYSSAVRYFLYKNGVEKFDVPPSTSFSLNCMLIKVKIEEGPLFTEPINKKFPSLSCKGYEYFETETGEKVKFDSICNGRLRYFKVKIMDYLAGKPVGEEKEFYYLFRREEDECFNLNTLINPYTKEEIKPQPVCKYYYSTEGNIGECTCSYVEKNGDLLEETYHFFTSSMEPKKEYIIYGCQPVKIKDEDFFTIRFSIFGDPQQVIMVGSPRPQSLTYWEVKDGKINLTHFSQSDPTGWYDSVKEKFYEKYPGAVNNHNPDDPMWKEFQQMLEETWKQGKQFIPVEKFKQMYLDYFIEISSKKLSEIKNIYKVEVTTDDLLGPFFKE